MGGQQKGIYRMSLLQQKILGRRRLAGGRGASEGSKGKNERTKRILEGGWRSQERGIKVAPGKGRIDRRTEGEARSRQRGGERSDIPSCEAISGCGRAGHRLNFLGQCSARPGQMRMQMQMREREKLTTDAPYYSTLLS